MILISHLSALYITLRSKLFKHPDNTLCINLLIRHCQSLFKKSLIVENGLSDFHEIILTLFKFEASQKSSSVVTRRNYKHFDSQNFENLIANLI